MDVKKLKKKSWAHVDPSLGICFADQEMMDPFQQEDFISKNLQREINAEERENAITNLKGIWK